MPHMPATRLPPASSPTSLLPQAVWNTEDRRTTHTSTQGQNPNKCIDSSSYHIWIMVTSTYRLVFSLVTLSIGRMGGVVEAKPAVGLARWARLTVVLRRLPSGKWGGRLASITKGREGSAGRAECSREAECSLELEARLTQQLASCGMCATFVR